MAEFSGVEALRTNLPQAEAIWTELDSDTTPSCSSEVQWAPEAGQRAAGSDLSTSRRRKGLGFNQTGSFERGETIIKEKKNEKRKGRSRWANMGWAMISSSAQHCKYIKLKSFHKYQIPWTGRAGPGAALSACSSPVGLSPFLRHAHAPQNLTRLLSSWNLRLSAWLRLHFATGFFVVRSNFLLSLLSSISLPLFRTRALSLRWVAVSRIISLLWCCYWRLYGGSVSS